MPEPTTLLLTGATGFLGTRVAGELDARGLAWRPLRSRLHQISAADLDGVTTIVHCAALNPGPGRRDDDFFEVNAEGTRRLVAACEASGVRRFVHVSSMGVKSASAYGRSKLAAEDSVRRSRLEWLILRPAQVIGPNDDLRRIFEKMQRRIVWSLLASGRTRLHIVYVGDCARAIVDAALSARARETLNIIGPEYSEVEYFRAVRKVAGSKLLFVPKPWFRLRRRQLPPDARAAVGLRTPGVADWPLAATPLETALRESYQALVQVRGGEAKAAG